MTNQSAKDRAREILESLRLGGKPKDSWTTSNDLAKIDQALDSIEKIVCDEYESILDEFNTPLETHPNSRMSVLRGKMAEKWGRQ